MPPHPTQGGNNVLVHGYDVLAPVLRLSYEATTGSSPCRRRSVWRISQTSTSTAAAACATTSTRSDKLGLDQHDEIDVDQSYCGREGVFGKMRSCHDDVSCCRCMYLRSCLMIDWARALDVAKPHNSDA